jgi:hypothetical protein
LVVAFWAFDGVGHGRGSGLGTGIQTIEDMGAPGRVQGYRSSFWVWGAARGWVWTRSCHA